jgi:hypothetical protein
VAELGLQRPEKGEISQRLEQITDANGRYQTLSKGWSHFYLNLRKSPVTTCHTSELPFNLVITFSCTIN